PAQDQRGTGPLKAMVLNGLGFANRRLYLMPEFFRNKPTERLVGAGISPEHLNDEALGKALDALYAFGLTELYRLIARRAAERLGLGSGVGWQWRTWIPPASTWTGATTATWMISTKRRGAHPREQGLQPGS
ncbi:MAG TPA: DUF4277 domain-containing protein, partial [Rubrobacter sp.]|nr:DUF4277 domain-containing protein [Rubrobacter sp.]